MLLRKKHLDNRNLFIIQCTVKYCVVISSHVWHKILISMPKKRRIYESPLSVAVGFLAERRREKTLSLVANGSAKTSRRWIPCLSISHHERESSRPCGSLMGWSNFSGNCTDSFFGAKKQWATSNCVLATLVFTRKQ